MDDSSASGCGMVALAIISGDIGRLERCLKKGGFVDEQEHIWGATPLHIACVKNWREGVEMLLNARADVDILARGVTRKSTAWDPITVLEYAFKFSSPDLISLILDKKPIMSFNGRSELFLLFSEARGGCVPEIFYLGVRELRDRRVELARLAHQLDGDIEIPDRVLDAEAWHVYQRLSRKYIIPLYLRPSIGRTSSVFCERSLTPSLAEFLWSYGFLDVDIMDDDGYTPILLSELKKGMLSWFLSKGVKLEARPPLETWAIAHWVGHRIGQYGHCYEYHWNQSNTLLHELFEALTTFDQIDSACNLADDCRCACTSGGCTMLTACLKRLWYGDGDLCKALNIWTSYFPLEISAGREQWLAGLRFVLFQEMHMEHTCCRLEVHEVYGEYYMWKPHRIKSSASEVSEIQEIEVKDIHRLDAILTFASDLMDGRYSKFEDLAAYVLQTFVHEAKPETLAMIDRQAGLDPEYSDQENEDQESSGQAHSDEESSDEEYFDPETEDQESED